MFNKSDQTFKLESDVKKIIALKDFIAKLIENISVTSNLNDLFVLHNIQKSNLNDLVFDLFDNL